MSYYIIESYDKSLDLGGVLLHGIPTIGHSRALWLYVVNTGERPMDWPESSTGRGSKNRRAPAGVGNWWVVVRGAKAKSNDGLRSTGSPSSTAPSGYPLFNWPCE